MKQPIAVIGAGIIGLATGLRLLEKDYEVVIYARDITGQIASRGAPALWMPYKVFPEDLVIKWAKTSLQVYQDLNHTAGVEIMDLIEYRNDEIVPIWARILGQHEDLPPASLPKGYTRGLAGQVHRIDSGVFLDYLIQQIKSKQGTLIEKEFSNFNQIDERFKTIINCSGVGSHKLVPDDLSFPIRGQYVLTEKIPLKEIILATIDDNNYILIVPRVNDCWLGGNAIADDWNMEVDPNISELIFKRACSLEPLLEKTKILHTGVGLRPGRESVRLVPEQLPDDRLVIHNYGHGGAGFTITWGCADEVVNLVENL